MLKQQGSLRCLVKCNCCWCILPSGQVACKTDVRGKLVGPCLLIRVHTISVSNECTSDPAYTVFEGTCDLRILLWGRSCM